LPSRLASTVDRGSDARRSLRIARRELHMEAGLSPTAMQPDIAAFTGLGARTKSKNSRVAIPSLLCRKRGIAGIATVCNDIDQYMV
jgi:hypothetical protein